MKFVPLPKRVTESCGLVGCHLGDGVETGGVVPASSAASDETTQSRDASVAVTAETSVVEKERFTEPFQTASILSTPSALSSQVAGVAREVRGFWSRRWRRRRPPCLHISVFRRAPGGTRRTTR